MVVTDNSRLDFEHFAWQLNNHNSMNASVEIKQQESFQMNINHENCIFFKCMGGIQQFAIPPLPSFEVEQLNVVQGSRQFLSPHFQNSFGTFMPYQKEKESMHYADGPSGMPVSKSTNGSYPKGFLIFDQSGNQKRLMYAPMWPPVYIPSIVTENKRCGWLEEKGAVRDINSVKYSPNTLSNENYVADGESSEMHENTEEIDALLYSDYDGTGCSSDDEVTSTGHSPEMINEHCEKEEQCQETTSEFASSDVPRKRQRVHDGGYIKSLPIAASCARVESQNYANDAELSCGVVHKEEAGADIDFCYSSCKKGRIKETLRVLESLVPGAKGKDPLLVIDEAIDYLKSLKHEATALGTKDSRGKPQRFERMGCDSGGLC